MKKITFIFAFIAFCFNAQAQFSEDFEGGVPGAFTETQDASGIAWGTCGGSLGGQTCPISGSASATFYRASYTPTLTSLTTPTMDLSAGGYRLSFNHSQLIWAPDQNTLLVEISTDGGGSWTTIENFTGNIPTVVSESYLLDAYTTTATTQIRFTGRSVYGRSIVLDDVVVDVAPTCTTTVVDSTTVVSDCAGEQYSVELVVSTVGDGVNFSDGTNTYPIVAGTVTAGPYNYSTSVTLNVVHSDSDCDFSLGEFFSDCVPECATTPFPADNATDVPFGDITFTWSAPATGVIPTSYDLYAVDNLAGDNPGLIGNFATASADITINVYNTTIYWLVIPKNGEVEATGCSVWNFTTEESPGYCFNAPFGQFPSAPAGVTPATCDGTTSNTVTTLGYNGEYSMINVVSGQTYRFTSSVATDFVTIGDAAGENPLTFGVTPVTWTSTVDGQIRFYTHNNDQCGTDDVSRTRAIVCGPTLGLEDETLSEFTYAPNPVKGTLNLKAQNNIQNVAVYNMLGQEVLRNTPNTLESNVDMSSLQTGAYFVKVTINDATQTIRVVKQ